MIDNELLSEFIIEATEHLENIEPKLMLLTEETPEKSDIINDIFRSMHSLKGASGFLGLHEINRLAHTAESIMDSIRKGEATPNEHIDTIIDLTDAIAKQIRTLSQNPQNTPDTVLQDSKEEIAKENVNQKQVLYEQCKDVITQFLAEPENLSYAIQLLRIFETLLIHVEKAQEALLYTSISEVHKLLSTALEDNMDITLLIPILEQELMTIQLQLEKTATSQPATTHNNNEEKTIGLQHKPPITRDYLRVGHAKLDMLMNLIGELIITRNRYSLLLQNLEQIRLLEKSPSLSTECSTCLKQTLATVQDLVATTSTLARISDSLQRTIMQVRMVSLHGIFNKLPRMVRDVGKQVGKHITIHTEGEETEIDKNMVDALTDPILHLLRNAIDHGIEDPEERIRKGKEQNGNIYVSAAHRGNSITITVTDDGRGMNPEKLKQIAVQKGLISEQEAAILSETKAFELIFMPGFSSADTITDISGRGVGMDVVRTTIEELKGDISIYSTMDQGTTFVLRFPLTLAIIEALLVDVAQQTFALPLDTILETTKIEKEAITVIHNTPTITLRNEIITLVSLQEYLGFSAHHIYKDIISVIIIQHNGVKIGLIVDKLLDLQEIVIKSLDKTLLANTCISSATITGNGDIVLILNIMDIANSVSSTTMDLISTAV